jgi:hypothetical protein
VLTFRYVWEEESGNLCNTIDSDNGLVGPVTCTSCHPSKAIIAASSYGAQQPILLINLSKEIKVLIASLTLTIKPIAAITPVDMATMSNEDNAKSIKTKYDLLSAIPEPPPLNSASNTGASFSPDVMKRRYKHVTLNILIYSYDLPKSPLRPISNFESSGNTDSKFIDGTPEDLERRRQKRMRRIRREKLLTELHSHEEENSSNL